MYALKNSVQFTLLSLQLHRGESQLQAYFTCEAVTASIQARETVARHDELLGSVFPLD